MGFESNYSFVDRAIHKIAFRTYSNLQTVLSDLEDSLYQKRLASIAIKEPVFITALPRAGTTLLLEIVMSSGEFVTHSYRDMPFVLIPVLWDRFTSGFQKHAVPRERAHGDGMMISADSYEAFEEIVWNAFYKDHYEPDRIVPWSVIGNPEFVSFFKKHIRKLILLRAKNTAEEARYVSKNNLNIARTGVIAKLFRDARIIVPFRNPLQHATSLLRQHLNFTALHQKDPFSREFMAAIGHYDFGANLRPVDFGAWFETAVCTDPFQLGFWVEYWTATYAHLLGQSGNIHFLSYDRLCEKPGPALEALADVISTKDRSKFAHNVSRLKPAKPHPVEVRAVDPARIAGAEAVHEQLLLRSIL